MRSALTAALVVALAGCCGCRVPPPRAGANPCDVVVCKVRPDTRRIA